jgi:O-antigen/teichoic acid export membrane protein
MTGQRWLPFGKLVGKWLATEDGLLIPHLKNSGYLLSGNAASLVLGMVQGALTARTLGVTGYGLLVTALTVVSVVNLFISFRVADFTVKYLTETLEDGDRIQAGSVVKLSYYVEGGSALLGFAILAASAPWLAGWFLEDEGGAAILRVAALSLLANLLTETSTGVVRAFKRFALLSRFVLLQSGLLVLAVAIAYLAKASLGGFLWATVLAALVQTLVFQRAVLRVLVDELGPDWWRPPALALRRRRSALRFLVSTNLGSTLSLVSKNTDVLWLSVLRTPTEVAYYKLALSLANLVGFPIGALSQTFYPQIVSLVKARNLVQLRALLRHGTAVALGWLAVGSLGCLALSYVAIPALYGAGFLPAIPAMVVILAGVALSGAFFWISPTLLAIDRPGAANAVNLGSILFQVPLVLAIVPAFGYLGNSIVTTIVRSFHVAALFAFVVRRLRG